MIIDSLIEKIILKKNPCIVGIDPDWCKIPSCYKNNSSSKADTVLKWSVDIIDTVSDIVPAIKPQIAFFEVLGWEGFRAYQELIEYAHSKHLIVIDDSKRNDIGNTSIAYAFSHISKSGPLNADFMTVSPFLGIDSIKPFIDIAIEEGKGVFILTKTSNIGSSDISNAITTDGDTISEWLAKQINAISNNNKGTYGYSGIGAVVGATFPNEAKNLRKIMPNSFFLVPGFAAQGASVYDVLPCFNEDGLGAVINSSRGILYSHLNINDFNNTRSMYLEIVRNKSTEMRDAIYCAIKDTYPNTVY